jgi:acyl-CoA dehydrogenase
MIRNPENFQQFLASIRNFVRAECLPLEEMVDRNDEIPEELVDRIRVMGFFGHSISRQKAEIIRNWG